MLGSAEPANLTEVDPWHVNVDYDTEAQLPGFELKHPKVGSFENGVGDVAQRSELALNR